MNFFDMNSEADNLDAEEERILASFTRSLIEMTEVAGARGSSGTSPTAALNAMRLPAIALDLHGFVTEVNAAAEAVFDNDFRIKDRRLFVRDPPAQALLKEAIDQLKTSPRLNPLASEPIIVRRNGKLPVIVRTWRFDGAAHRPAQDVCALLTFILIEEGQGEDKFCRTLTAKRLRAAIQKLGYNTGFQFYKTGQKLDRQAIVSLERDALASLICQADETGRGKSVTCMSGHKYIIGKNHRSEAICLLWNGINDSEVTPEHLKKASKEVSEAGLKRPFRIYGTFCRVGDTTSWKFCQIPDEIIAQMHIEDDEIQSEAECPA